MKWKIELLLTMPRQIHHKKSQGTSPELGDLMHGLVSSTHLEDGLHSWPFLLGILWKLLELF